MYNLSTGVVYGCVSREEMVTFPVAICQSVVNRLWNNHKGPLSISLLISLKSNNKVQVNKYIKHIACLNNR